MKKSFPIASLLTNTITTRPSVSLNYVRAGIAALRKPEKVNNAPIAIHIEPTTACNLKCTTCERTYATDLNIGAMSFDVFKEILGNFSHLLGSNQVQTGLLLTGLGEPFLNKDIYRMIRYAKENGQSYVHSISNGTVLNEGNNQKIIQSGLDHISFSMDGATKEPFESIRIGAEFDKVVENLKDLAARRKNRTDLFIDLNITLQGNSNHELLSAVELALEVGADRVSARTLNEDFARNQVAKTKVTADELMKITEFANKKHVDFRYADDDSDPCFYPWIWPYITWDGYLVPCCYKSNPRQFNFGNLLEASFDDIWNGEKYREFRRALVSDTPPETCTHCPKRPGARRSD